MLTRAAKRPFASRQSRNDAICAVAISAAFAAATAAAAPTAEAPAVEPAPSQPQPQEVEGWIRTVAMAPDAYDGPSPFLLPGAVGNLERAADPGAKAAADPDHTQTGPGDPRIVEGEAFTLDDVAVDLPEAYGSALEGDARRVVADWLAERRVEGGAAAAARAMTLSIDVRVASDYWKPRWRSPLYIAYADSALWDGRTIVDGFALGLDTDANRIRGAPRISMRMVLTEDGARVWAGFAGAPVKGAARSQIAKALALALIERAGRNVDEPLARFAIDAAPLVTIVEGEER